MGYRTESFWEQFNWANVQKSTLYKSTEWSQSLSKSDQDKSIERSLGIEITHLGRSEINIDGKKTYVDMDRTKTVTSPVYSVSFYIQGPINTNLNEFERWRDLFRKQFDQDPVYYDDSADSFIINTYRWDIGNTVVELTYFNGNISLTYENADTSKKRRLKSLVYLTCEFGLRNNRDNKYTFVIDEKSNTIKDMANNVLNIKVASTENNFRLNFSDHMTIDINRLDGKITGWFKDNGNIMQINGMCEKLNPDQPKF